MIEQWVRRWPMGGRVSRGLYRHWTGRARSDAAVARFVDGTMPLRNGLADSALDSVMMLKLYGQAEACQTYDRRSEGCDACVARAAPEGCPGPPVSARSVHNRRRQRADFCDRFPRIAVFYVRERIAERCRCRAAAVGEHGSDRLLIKGEPLALDAQGDRRWV